MSETSQTTNESKILGAFAGALTLFSIALYFTGWIYRWAYFGSFRINILSLDLPTQSFFIIPIQVFLGSWQAFLLTLLLILGSIVLVPVLLKGTSMRLENFSPRNNRRGNVDSWLSIVHRQIVKSLNSPLLRDLVIVACILTVLFWIARWKGEADAWEAMFNDTSLLPVITLVQPEKGLGLGYSPKDKTYSLSDKVRIIGDVGLFENYLRGSEVKIPGSSSQIGDWRLLVSSKGWLYLFQGLPPNSDPKKRPRPLVLAVREGGGEQLMILSPSASKEKSP
ncbi:hypothetical protein [Nostoc sp. CCY 9925]|uniref:hypothetical protein n=1 Tax=Nostoc sp. CCY 9925 TaxID=3103865 RepID=UPI0039C5AFC7